MPFNKGEWTDFSDISKIFDDKVFTIGGFNDIKYKKYK